MSCKQKYLEPFIPAPALIDLARAFLGVASRGDLVDYLIGLVVASSIRESLSTLGASSFEDRGLLLSNSEGLTPSVRMSVLSDLPVDIRDKQRAAPLLAEEFCRLAKIPDLPMEGRLVYNAATGDVHMFKVRRSYPSLVGPLPASWKPAIAL